MSDQVERHLGPKQPHPQSNLPKNMRRFSNLNMLTPSILKQIQFPTSHPVLLSSSGILEVATRKPKQVKGKSIQESAFNNKPLQPQKRLDEMDKQQLLEHFKKERDALKAQPSKAERKAPEVQKGPESKAPEPQKPAEEKLTGVKAMANKFAVAATQKPQAFRPSSMSQSMQLGKQTSQQPPQRPSNPQATQQPPQQQPPQQQPPAVAVQQPTVETALPAPGKLDIKRMQLPMPGMIGLPKPQPLPQQQQQTSQPSLQQPSQQPTQQTQSQQQPSQPSEKPVTTGEPAQKPALSAVEQRIKNLQEAQDRLKQTQLQKPNQALPNRITLPAPGQQSELPKPSGLPAPKPLPNFKVSAPEEQKSQAPPSEDKPKPAPVRGRVGTVSSEFMAQLNSKIAGPPGSLPGFGMPMPRPKKIEDEPKPDIEVDYSDAPKQTVEIGNKINNIMTQSLGGRLPMPNFTKPIEKQEETPQEQSQAKTLLDRAVVKGRARQNTAAFDL